MVANIKEEERDKDVYENEDSEYGNIDDEDNEETENKIKIKVQTQIKHRGESNKARYMPQYNKHNIIASFTCYGDINIYDTYNVKTNKDQGYTKPEVILKGHTKEGYAISWSSFKEGKLVSGANDGKVIMLFVLLGILMGCH